MTRISRMLCQTASWAKADYNSGKVRFIAEWIGWMASMSSAVWFALSQPNPPMSYLYPIWLFNVIVFAICSWSRRSTWMMINYSLLAIIDTIGYYIWLTSK